MKAAPDDKLRQLRDLEFLADVTQETLGSLHAGSLLWRVTQLLNRRFGYDFAAIGLKEDDALVFRAASGVEKGELGARPPEPPWRVPLGTGIAGEVADSGVSRLLGQIEGNAAELPRQPGSRSELAVPLAHRDRVIGVLDVQSRHAQAFDETDQHLLQIVAALVAPAVVTARTLEGERRRSRHLRLINEIGRLVASSLDPDEVVAVACRSIRDELDFSFVTVLLEDQGSGEWVHVGHATRLPFAEDLEIERLRLDPAQRGALSELAQGHPLRVADVGAQSSYRAFTAGARSALWVPLRAMGRIVGVLGVEHAEPAYFGKDDEHLLGHLGGFLAQAIENARLFESQRRRWHQLLLINEVARTATISIDLAQIVDNIAREVRDRFGYFAVAVFLCEEREIALRALACERQPQLALGYREPLGAGLAGTVGATGQTVRADDPEAFGGSPPAHQQVQSVLCVPLVASERVIGALQLQSTRRDTFDEDERLVMETLARSVAGAVANAMAVAQGEQLREDLNRMIVHDLRNPVQTVLYGLQEAQRLELPDSNREQLVEAMHCTEDILDMINSLLDVVRFEGGRTSLRLEPAVLNDHLRGVVRRFAAVARSKGIQLTTVLSQELPVMQLDHDLIKRMLGNLVGNALKFTPPGTPVTIRSELISDGEGRRGVKPPCAVVSVNDRGEGIPPEYYEKIFEKFGQVESRKAGLKMSTGLGLALCRYVVEAHRGRIWVESEVGKGSTFYVVLPV